MVSPVIAHYDLATPLHGGDLDVQLSISGMSNVVQGSPEFFRESGRLDSHPGKAFNIWYHVALLEG
jgi:hypothetical protein